jgi:hypothetical protein
LHIRTKHSEINDNNHSTGEDIPGYENQNSPQNSAIGPVLSQFNPFFPSYCGIFAQRNNSEASRDSHC